MKSTLISAISRQARMFSLLVLLSLVGLSSVQADGHNRIADGLRKTLIAAMPFPAGAIATPEQSNTVQLSFMITEDRKLDVIRVEGSNRELNRYVLDQLDGIAMNRYSSFIGKMIKVKLSFEPKF
jgi:hypothetical protein